MLKKVLKAAAAVLVLGSIMGLYYSGVIDFGGGGEEDSVPTDAQGEPILPPIYLPLDPAFVVNFQHRGTLHYLQMDLQMMYHDQKTIDRIVKNMPAVRNDLILLFSNQEFEKLSTHDGKELLRDEIVATVNNIAGVEPDPETGESDGEVYITNFVMQ